MALLLHCIILLPSYANLALADDTWFSYMSLSALVQEGQEKETELMNVLDACLLLLNDRS